MNPNPQIDAEDMTGECQVCHYPQGIVFNRGKNMYGLPDGTVLCALCLDQHKKWMEDNNVWTGDSVTTQPQEIHAEPLQDRLKRVLRTR